jgi:hypothetical protein
VENLGTHFRRSKGENNGVRMAKTMVVLVVLPCLKIKIGISVGYVEEILFAKPLMMEFD